MFTTIKAHYAGNEKSYIEAACLSTDTKPTDGIANGSACIEMDTGDKYMFDEAGGQWIKLGSGGGGQAEVWLVGDTYQDSGGRMFQLSNVGDTDHMAELLTNGENYKVYLNGDELVLVIQTEQAILWADSTDESTMTKTVQIMIVSGETLSAVSEYVDASTAPDSVEVSVKAK